MTPRRLRTVHDRLLAFHGPQHWWPGETRFEIMVGAVLTQSTAWTNVERAIGNLRANRALTPTAISGVSERRLARWLRPSGYFNVKARRLQAFCAWLMQSGGESALARMDTPELRRRLLAVHGVGPETADDILLYAFARPVFVIDAYTRRLFRRLGFITGRESYDELRLRFERSLGPDVPLYNEYHALIVSHGKDICRVRPRCEQCVLSRRCKQKFD